MEIRNHVYHFAVDPKLTGKRIKELRKDRNMTAQNLADALLCSVKTISSWETGARFPSIDNLVDLSNFFDVSVHSLMLPLDNCPIEPVEPYLNEVALPENPTRLVHRDSDDEIADCLVREEYLLQRIAAGVFSNKNKYEYNTIMAAFNYQFDPFSENGETSPNTLEEFWRLKKAYVYSRKSGVGSVFEADMKAVIFNRILRGDKLDRALQTMDLFERSVFLTMLCYFPELRSWNCAKVLYESGARFIDCNFFDNLDKIQEGELEKEKERLFNIAVGTFEEVYGFSGKDMSDFDRDFFGVPSYSEDPAFYEIKQFCLIGDDCKDPNERKKLAAYYYLFDFITDSVASLYDLEKQMVAGDNAFDVYINELRERGLIAE